MNINQSNPSFTGVFQIVDKRVAGRGKEICDKTFAAIAKGANGKKGISHTLDINAGAYFINTTANKKPAKTDSAIKELLENLNVKFLFKDTTVPVENGKSLRKMFNA